MVSSVPAVGVRVFVYFVRDHTRPTVPRDRSAAALRDVGEVPEILIISDMIRVGKGLTTGATCLERSRKRR